MALCIQPRHVEPSRLGALDSIRLGVLLRAFGCGCAEAGGRACVSAGERAGEVAVEGRWRRTMTMGSDSGYMARSRLHTCGGSRLTSQDAERERREEREGERMCVCV